MRLFSIPWFLLYHKTSDLPPCWWGRSLQLSMLGTQGPWVTFRTWPPVLALLIPDCLPQYVSYKIISLFSPWGFSIWTLREKSFIFYVYLLFHWVNVPYLFNHFSLMANWVFFFFYYSKRPVCVCVWLLVVCELGSVLYSLELYFNVKAIFLVEMRFLSLLIESQFSQVSNRFSF